MRHLTYLGLLTGCMLLTLPLDLVLGARVFRRLRILLLAVAPTFVLFTLWDLYAISRRQWSYDLRWMTGVVLPGGLPLEEALFFVVIPLAAVLTYEGVRCWRGIHRSTEGDRSTPGRLRERSGNR